MRRLSKVIPKYLIIVLQPGFRKHQSEEQEILLKENGTKKDFSELTMIIQFVAHFKIMWLEGGGCH